MHKIFLAALIAISILATSCGASTEDKLVSTLAQTICMADEAYRAIDSAKNNASNMSIQDLLTKTDEISKRVDALKSTNFGSPQQLEEAKAKVVDKKALTERAVAEAKKQCAPSVTSIEQATRDYK